MTQRSAAAEHLDPGVLRGYEALRRTCGELMLPSVSLIEVTGADRKEWLQGQATNDLRGLEPGGAVSFCFCQPTGQIAAVCDMWAFDDRYLLSCETSCAGAVMQRFRDMVVLEDVQARDVTDEYSLSSIQGPAAGENMRQLLQRDSKAARKYTRDGGEAILLSSDRNGLGGWDVWTRKGGAASSLFSVPQVGQEAAEIARLEAGIPKFGQDITSKTLPPELGPAFAAKHVSYTKGCYTGQEVLMRIHSRGHTNRTWMGLRLGAPVEPGAKVVDADKSEVGYVTSAAVSPTFGPIAAAMLRNEVAMDGHALYVSAKSGEAAAIVVTMPFLKRLD